jgi:anti-sigma B factor antagonist
MGLSINHKLEDNINIVTLSGRIDAETATTFEEKLIEFSTQSKNTLLDFGDVHHMNSFGIGILVCAQKQQLNVGGNIKIVRLQPNIRKIFQITYLTKVFEIYEEMGEAIASFKKETPEIEKMK